MDQTTPQKTSTGIDLERVRASIGPVLSARGVSLVEAEWVTDRAGWILRLTIEHEGSLEDSGGVTLEDCVDVSRGVSEVLDAEDFIVPAYNLEVSSPGLDRPLRTGKDGNDGADFARFKGRLARVKLNRPAPDGQRLLRGALLEAPAGLIAVLVDGKRIEAPLGDVAEANLVFELGPQPKKGQATKGQRAPAGNGGKGGKGGKGETSGGKRAASGKTGLPAGKSS